MRNRWEENQIYSFPFANEKSEYLADNITKYEQYNYNQSSFDINQNSNNQSNLNCDKNELNQNNLLKFPEIDNYGFGNIGSGISSTQPNNIYNAESNPPQFNHPLPSYYNHTTSMRTFNEFYQSTQTQKTLLQFNQAPQSKCNLQQLNQHHLFHLNLPVHRTHLHHINQPNNQHVNQAQLNQPPPTVHKACSQQFNEPSQSGNPPHFSNDSINQYPNFHNQYAQTTYTPNQPLSSQFQPVIPSYPNQNSDNNQFNHNSQTQFSLISPNHSNQSFPQPSQNNNYIKEMNKRKHTPDSPPQERKYRVNDLTCFKRPQPLKRSDREGTPFPSTASRSSERIVTPYPPITSRRSEREATPFPSVSSRRYEREATPYLPMNSRRSEREAIPFPSMASKRSEREATPLPYVSSRRSEREAMPFPSALSRKYEREATSFPSMASKRSEREATPLPSVSHWRYEREATPFPSESSRRSEREAMPFPSMASKRSEREATPFPSVSHRRYEREATPFPSESSRRSEREAMPFPSMASKRSERKATPFPSVSSRRFEREATPFPSVSSRKYEKEAMPFPSMASKGFEREETPLTSMSSRSETDASPFPSVMTKRTEKEVTPFTSIPSRSTAKELTPPSPSFRINSDSTMSSISLISERAGAIKPPLPSQKSEMEGTPFPFLVPQRSEREGTPFLTSLSQISRIVTPKSSETERAKVPEKRQNKRSKINEKRTSNKNSRYSNLITIPSISRTMNLDDAEIPPSKFKGSHKKPCMNNRNSYQTHSEAKKDSSSITKEPDLATQLLASGFSKGRTIAQLRLKKVILGTCINDCNEPRCKELVSKLNHLKLCSTWHESACPECQSIIKLAEHAFTCVDLSCTKIECCNPHRMNVSAEDTLRIAQELLNLPSKENDETEKKVVDPPDYNEMLDDLMSIIADEEEKKG